MNNFFTYLFVMAMTTYFIRMLPLVLVKKRITNRYLLSFLKYIPYAVLAVMTVPSIFYSTSFVPAMVGFIVAVIFAYYEKSLVMVACFSCLAVFITELISNLL